MRPRFYYGYVILFLCFVNTMFGRGAVASFSVFYVALLEDFHWSHAVGASVVSLNSLVYASASPVVGYLFDRLGPRALMPLAGLLMGIGFVMSGFSHSIWDLFLFYGIVAAVGQSGLGFVTQSALLSAWFVRRRATAIGLASAGQGFGMITLVPLAQFWIARAGWRAAFMLVGAFILLAVVPLNATFQRRTPALVGQFPDGASGAVVDPKLHGVRVTGRHWTLAAALRSVPFWTLALGHLALGTALFIIYTHFVAHLVEYGFEKLTAAFLFGIVGFMRIVGTFVWGYASDRLGRAPAYGLSILVAAVGILAIAAIGSGMPPSLVYAAAVVYGLGHSAGNPTYGAVIGDIFAGKNIGTIFGFLEITFGIGMAVGSWAGGAIFDATGSYRAAFMLSLACFVLSFVAIQASAAWNRKNAPAIRY